MSFPPLFDAHPFDELAGLVAGGDANGTAVATTSIPHVARIAFTHPHAATATVTNPHTATMTVERT